jgi:hypothetical protein
VGIEPEWSNDVVCALETLGIHTTFLADPELVLLAPDGGSVVLNLISVETALTPDFLIERQAYYHSRGMLMIQLWEDIWLTRKAQVLSRITSLLGRNKRIHARKTKVDVLDRQRSDAFLAEHHLQGTVKARYKFGLIYEEELVAVATFSGSRLMKHKAPGYRSAELIRFASKSGFTVIGGLTKLIRHYVNLVHPDDLMSYADRDWSQGKAYESLGFSLDRIQAPSWLWLDIRDNSRYFPHRLPPAVPHEYLLQIFNTGNLKYVLYL